MSNNPLNKKTLSVADIAEKNGCSLLAVKQQLVKGIKVEMEHTSNPRVAKEIALDHIGERLDYYKRLKKVESGKVSEETVTGDARGLGYVSGDPAGTLSYVDQYKGTNALAYDDQNGAVFKWIRKQHADLHNQQLGFKAFDPTEQNHRSTKLKEQTALKTLGGDIKEMDNPCWKGYKSYGTKMKNGKKVPNCVPVEEGLDEVAMAMPPNVEAPVPAIRRAAPSQQQRMQGSTYRAGQSFSQQGTRVSPSNVRMGSNYGTMKPTSTQVTRNISGNYRAGFSQQATGSIKPTSVGGSTSFSQGGSNIGSKMAASKQTSPVVKGMTNAGREAAAVVSKAAPTVAKGLGAAARFAGGPAATAAAAVMSPTPAGAGEDEKKRQDTLKSFNPYKSQGRSVSQYEKDVLTPKASETPRPKVDAPTPPERPQYFTRGQAFSAARGEAGGGEGKFSYQSGSDTSPKTYQTNVKSEPYKPESQLKQTSIKEGTAMDTKEKIYEAIENILDSNLVNMKENFSAVLQEKAVEKLEEIKKGIAANYFSE